FPAQNPIFRAASRSGDRHATLAVRVRLETALRDRVGAKQGDTAYSIEGNLSSFGIVLLPSIEFLNLNFKQLTFKASSTEKPNVQVQFDDNGVELKEALSFVKPLQALLSPSTGPFVELSTQGIRSGYSFNIAQVPIGPLILSNLGFVIAIDMPFD